MDEEPDPSGEAVREELEVDPTEARSQGLAFAAARIIQMALQTQAEVWTLLSLLLHCAPTVQNPGGCAAIQPCRPLAQALATLAKQDPSALESAASWGFRR